MKLVVTYEDIQQAVMNHLAANGVTVDNTKTHIQFVVENGEIHASIDINAVKLDSPAATPVTAEQAVTAAPEPADDPPDTPDRETIKKELDERGIEYLPKAHTSTLQALLDEARAKDPKPHQVEDPPFATDPAPAAEAPAAEATSDSPFGQPAKSAEPEAEAAQAEPEAEEENKPLFGN